MKPATARRSQTRFDRCSQAPTIPIATLRMMVMMDNSIVSHRPRSMRARKVAPGVKRGDIIAVVAARKALTFEIGRHDDKRTYAPLEFGSHVPHWEIAAWAAPANEQIIELPRVAA